MLKVDLKKNLFPEKHCLLHVLLQLIELVLQQNYSLLLSIAATVFIILKTVEFPRQIYQEAVNKFSKTYWQ